MVNVRNIFFHQSSNILINLISDTVTIPTEGMLKAMMSANVGDDVFNEDTSVNALQRKLADMFGMEAGLFCPSGTMTNQIAIKTHTNPMDELICDKLSHVYKYENGGYAYNSGIGIKLIDGSYGKINPEQIRASVNPNYDWLTNSKLVVIENSCNTGGGTYYEFKEMEAIHDCCKELGLTLHLDGARLFNVLAETKDDPKQIGSIFDSISICLSKGLGAPVGSVLLGNKNFIARARKFRKAMGGGMRQAGYLAAACSYALDNHVDRLKLDNDRAKLLGATLQECSYVESVLPVMTNIVIFNLTQSLTATDFVETLKTKGIIASAFGPQKVRFVTHLNIDDKMIDETQQILKDLSE